MKKVIAAVYFIFLLHAVYAQVPRQILIEDFTEASSDASFLSAPGISDMIENNSPGIIALQYHTAFQGADPMNALNPLEVQTRTFFYNINSTPSITLDGNVFNGIPDNLAQSTITARSGISSPFAITMQHQLSVNKDSILITAVVRADQAYIGVTNLFIAVSETNIYFATPPGTTPRKRFEHVMKKMLPDDQGTGLPASWAANDSVVITESWELNGVYDANQLSVVGWVQELSTKEVLQAGLSRSQIPLDIGVTDVEFNDVICPGALVAKAKVKNFGTDVLTSCTVGYALFGGSNASHAWAGIIDPETTGIITLDTILPFPGVNYFSSAALYPNLGSDLDSMNDSNYFRFTVMDTILQPPLVEGFEGSLFPPLNWAVSNRNNDLTWEMDSISSYEGTNSGKISFLSGTRNRIDELYLPRLNFSGSAIAMKLYFTYAYTYFSDSNASRFDTLSVMASTDCGSTWTTIWQHGGSDLQTATERSTPYSPLLAEWKTDSIDLVTFNGTPEVLLKFSGKSGRGNNLYLDKLIINDTPTGLQESVINADFLLFPIPADNYLNIYFSGAKSEIITFRISDSKGTISLSKHTKVCESGNFQLDLSTFDNGVYFLTLIMDEQTLTKKMIVLH